MAELYGRNVEICFPQKEYIGEIKGITIHLLIFLSLIFKKNHF